jgi:phosphoribosylanthranilate isomerase
MKLKVCGMREAENCQELVESVRPDWMGVILYPPSPRYAGQQASQQIRQLDVKKVGVFVNENKAKIKKAIEDYGLSTIQLHGKESAEETKIIKDETGLEVFKVFSVTEHIDWAQMEAFLPSIDYVLFDTFTKAHGGSGKTFNWQLLKDYPFDKPFLLSGGIGPGHVGKILEIKESLPQLAGVDINSGFEIAPGLKDVELVREFKGMIK